MSLTPKEQNDAIRARVAAEIPRQIGGFESSDAEDEWRATSDARFLEVCAQASPPDLTPFCRAYIEAALWSTTLPPHSKCPTCGLVAVLDRWDDDDTLNVCRDCSDREPNHEPPADENYSLADIAPECLAVMVADCQKFQDENASLLEAGEQDASDGGHNFWLNREGHGTGFWDAFPASSCAAYECEQAIAIVSRDFSKREALGETCPCKYHACQRLSKAAQAFGPFSLYVGDDGKIYH